MKVVYIAGPYTSSTPYGVLKNVEVARDHAVEVWKMGAVAYCPHTNTTFFPGDYEGFMDGCFEVIKRSDAIFMCPGWQESRGSQRELRHAKKLGMPIFYSLEALENWIND